MLRCLRSSKIEPVDELTQQLSSMSKAQLIERCKTEITRNNTLTRSLENATSDMRAAQQLNARTNSTYDALRQTTDAQIRSLRDEILQLEMTAQGHRQAVNRQARELINLAVDMRDLKAELEQRNKCSTSVEMNITPIMLIKNARLMIEEMEKHLIDPVTLDLFADPITLETGHTYSRNTVIGMLRNGRAGFACPLSRWRVNPDPRQARSNVIATLVDLYTRMKETLDISELQMSQP
jgi:hypothetical protein